MIINDRSIGNQDQLFVIAGPCVIESRDLALSSADQLRRLADELDILIIYKSSFDKANRTSGTSFRGPGIDEGLNILSEVGRTTGLPILTDVHLPDQVSMVADIADVLQIPAFLCRQTDLLSAAVRTGKPTNIKKGQFVSPNEMTSVVKKARSFGGKDIMLCERGTTFGYHNLVVDIRGLQIMAETECPIIFDATHSVQLPGLHGDSSGGQREYIPVLARAAVAAGVAGLFMEVHASPDHAMSDGPNSWPISKLKSFLQDLLGIDNHVKKKLPYEY